MEEEFTEADLRYINEPFNKKDLEYIEEMNQEKYWFKDYNF